MKLRFAPSPTGHLHVGNARIALANWLVARKLGAELVLRLDDTDTGRSKAEFADAIEEDLRWLGLDWDSMFRQSDRLPLYAAAAERLKKSGHLYPCLETEEELNYKRELRLKQGRPPIYDRGALKMTAEQLARAMENGKRPHWRFKLSMTTIEWQDGVLGRRGVKLSAISDPVLIRADGSPLYTFTSVVDDLETRVTHVVRGEDHVTNTGVQLDIWRALGGKGLEFAHLPLLTDADGGPLSKRIGSLSLRQLRRDGVEAAAITGYLGALGTSHDPFPARPKELLEGFDLGAVSHSSPRFDPRQMLALNRKLLHAMSFEEARAQLPPGADATFWEAIRENLDLMPEAKHWWDVVRGHIAPIDQPEEAGFLAQARELLPQEPFDGATWTAWTDAVKAATGRKGKALFMPLRLALTGEDHGPDLKTLLPLIGRARAVERLRADFPA
ncbi:glutamate--tRNA ligase [Roseococcus pinisoli]|uniref:Glutamate--tRNA ligase n=1 Tax=Roseococcus pinisoli TaxID=2835040 RepID=A0ABS5Q7H6_9PROT|nr:glutamate--tRNA ligase [Roseococcus pinisoli]MBS7809610.1 glutamate--tRNA ligase [Roseococcus pinisoli]